MLHAPASKGTSQTGAGHTAAAPRPSQRRQLPGTSFSTPRDAGFAPQVSAWHEHYGNQAVLRMLDRSQPAIRTKLTVNQPGDAYEQDADRTAEQVMRMPSANALQSSSAGAQANSLQRKCAECDGEEKKDLQRKETQAGPAVAPPVVHDVLNSPGQPLDPAARAFVEPRFGRDFSQVRVHTDARAAESAAAMNARAYTAGSHVVFAKGEYAPHSHSGQFLLAHELAHVTQQGQDQSIKRTVAPQSSCTAGTNGAPDDLDLDGIDSTAADFAGQVADALATEADNVVNGLPDDPSTAFQAYQDHFGLPPARGQGFLNRLTGAVRPSQEEAASGELRILSRRFRLVATLFSQPVIYFCLAADQNRVFSNCLFTCAGERNSGSCRGRHAIGLCPPFWDHTLNQRAGGLIHEAMHIIFGPQSGTVTGGAIRDDDTVPQVPGRNFDVAGCYQSVAGDMFGFDPDVTCADPI